MIGMEDGAYIVVAKKQTELIEESEKDVHPAGHSDQPLPSSLYS